MKFYNILYTVGGICIGVAASIEVAELRKAIRESEAETWQEAVTSDGNGSSSLPPSQQHSPS